LYDAVAVLYEPGMVLCQELPGTLGVKKKKKKVRTEQNPTEKRPQPT
jgi:hypothetical protein